MTVKQIYTAINREFTRLEGETGEWFTFEGSSQTKLDAKRFDAKVARIEKIAANMGMLSEKLKKFVK